MKLTKQKLKQIIKEELESLQQQEMRIPTAEEIMQMDNCAELQELVGYIERSGKAFNGRVPTHEYLVAEKRFDELCLSTLNRHMDDEDNPLRPDDQDYGYTPPGGY